MPRVKKDVSISAMGKPTEATGVPQPRMSRSHSVMDGIVKGVARGTRTPIVDGLVRSAPMSKALDSPTLRAVPNHLSVIPGATHLASQQLGSIPYAMSRGGGM